MTESPDPDREHRPGTLVRDVLVVFIAGAALGIGFNAIQLRAEPSRALPWLHAERHVASLEDLAPSGATHTSTAAAPASAAPDSAAKSSKPARADSASARRKHGAGVAGKPAAQAAATAPAPAAASPAPASAPPAAAAPDVPVIPDSREPIEVKLEVTKKLYAANAALFVDARTAGEYKDGHIAGALDLPFDDVFKNPALVKSLDPKGRPIVCYCGGGDCELSKSLAFSLLDAGFHKVLVYTGGLPEWRDGGNAVHTGTQP